MTVGNTEYNSALIGQMTEWKLQTARSCVVLC